MDAAEVVRLQELLAKATPGPWAWFGNGRCDDVYLATVNRGRQYVMGFQRWGMRGAQPTFRVNGRMVPASALLKFEVGDQSVTGMEAAKANESVYRYDVRDIDAPDAALIVAAVNALPALLAQSAADRKALEAARGALEACHEYFACLSTMTPDDAQQAFDKVNAGLAALAICARAGEQ